MRTFPAINRSPAQVILSGRDATANVVSQMAEFVAAMAYSLYNDKVKIPNRGILVRINKEHLTMQIRSAAASEGYFEQILLESTKDEVNYTAILLSVSSERLWIPEQTVWRYSMAGDVEVPPITQFGLG